MNTKILLCCLSLLFFALPGNAQDKGKFSYSGFSGGMMLHAGYLYGGNIAIFDDSSNMLSCQNVEGLATGVGGAGKIHLGRHLRLGAEGYVSNLKYGKYKSSATIGWGGILADCMWNVGRFNPFVGATLGGGSFKNITLTSDTPLDCEVEGPSSFRKYAFMTAVPFAGLEFMLSDKIALVFKTDWMFNISSRHTDFASGPRFYFGFSFYRLKTED